MARAPREHLRCSRCGWYGVTARGRLRYAVYGVSLAAVVILVGLELLGVVALGDQVIAIGITIMLVSIGVRLVIRGDRCRECGGPAVYERRAPASGR